ncbi:hypothetical protein BDF22DRAFT_691248 [Syncephalis plumigaleata]|nr:hypothetical protein BDF22DRAFT_691248 [Syncephalis plumigaleata]
MKHTSIIVITATILAIGTSYTDATPLINVKAKLPVIGKILSTKPSSALMETEMLCLVNALRSKHHLPPLGIDGGLVKSSLGHSQVQANANTMSHQLPESRINAVGKWSGASENVAYNAASVVNWEKSPLHLKNMLGDYTHFGVAKVNGRNGPYWTQNFGKDTSKTKNIPRC